MLLADQSSHYEFLEADGLDTVLAALASHNADLLLVDLGMPGMNGAESLRALREAYPETKVVVITGSSDRSMILECLSAGVHGYILKSSSSEEIERAISTILSGQIYVSSTLAQFNTTSKPQTTINASAEQTSTPDVPQEPFKFTLRQLDVLRLLRQGHPTKAIARELDLGPGTVKIHLAAIYRILRARNRTEAVVLAEKLNP